MKFLLRPTIVDDILKIFKSLYIIQIEISNYIPTQCTYDVLLEYFKNGIFIICNLKLPIG